MLRKSIDVVRTAPLWGLLLFIASATTASAIAVHGAYSTTGTFQAENIHASGTVTIDGLAAIVHRATLSGNMPSHTSIAINETGSLDTTTGSREVVGVDVYNNVTKSAGAPPLSVIGLRGHAQGGDDNIAIESDGELLVNGGGALVTGPVYAEYSDTAIVTTSGYIKDQGAAPTKDAGCGTGANVVAGRYSGHVILGTGATTCNLTLSTFITTTGGATCVVSGRAGKLFQYDTNNSSFFTTIIITNLGGGNDISSTTVDWICWAE